MPLDAHGDDLIDRARPPVFRKDFDLAIARKPLRFDHGSNIANVDDAVSHHATIVQDVSSRHKPVANVKGKKP